MKLNTVLWSTRGRDWGFRMLLKPQIPCDDWLLSYEAMFNHTSTGEKQLNRGQVKLQDHNVPYVAVTFADPESRKDRSGRIIPHEIAIFGEESSPFEDFDGVQKAVWEKLSSVYLQLYEHEPAEMVKIQVISSNGFLEIINKEDQQKTADNQEEKPNFLVAIVILAAITLAIVLVILLQTISKKPEVPSPQLSATYQIVGEI